MIDPSNGCGIFHNEEDLEGNIVVLTRGEYLFY